MASLTRFCLILAGSTLICASGNEQYLKRVGPTLLRFKPEKVALDADRVLPVLRMDDKPDLSAEPLGPPASPPKPEELFAPDWTPLEYEAPRTTTTEPPAGQITPQMLLRYFNQAGTKELLVAPQLEFTPPAPPGRNSSAVYLSPEGK